jgi:hypothetical protein
MAIAESEALAELMVPCAGPPPAGLATFQAHPEHGLIEPFSPVSEVVPEDATTLVPTVNEEYALGASVFYGWLDRSFGAFPGSTTIALWALTPTVTPWTAARWNDEPDGFDVLRVSFKNALWAGSTVSDLWVDFAAARAFEPGAAPRADWSVDWPRKPRSILSAYPVVPTGSAYVAIDCAVRPAGARLRFEATWEPPSVFVWTLVRVGADGHEMSRVAVPGPPRGQDAQTTLVDLDGVARVIAVGTNIGTPPIAVDPDDYRPEGHGWVVSLDGE